MVKWLKLNVPPNCSHTYGRQVAKCDNIPELGLELTQWM